MDTVTTDSKGKATSKQLYLGKYEVREVTAPNCFVLSSKVKSVELTDLCGTENQRHGDNGGI